MLGNCEELAVEGRVKKGTPCPPVEHSYGLNREGVDLGGGPSHVGDSLFATALLTLCWVESVCSESVVVSVESDLELSLCRARIQGEIIVEVVVWVCVASNRTAVNWTLVGSICYRQFEVRTARLFCFCKNFNFPK